MQVESLYIYSNFLSQKWYLKSHSYVTKDCSLRTERQKERDGKDSRLKSDFLGLVLASWLCDLGQIT